MASIVARIHSPVTFDNHRLKIGSVFPCISGARGASK